MSGSRHPLSERLLAMIDALTDLTAVALDVQQLANAIAQNVAGLDGADGAAVALNDGDRLDILAVSEPALHDRRETFLPLFEHAASLERATYVAEMSAENARSVIAVPLAARGQRIGALVVYSREPRAFAAEDPELVWRFAKIVGPIVDLSVQFNRKLYESRTDELTGLQNRRAFDERLQRRIAEFERYGAPFTVVITDLDDFKIINDTYGHAAGDRVLTRVAQVVQSRVRGGDEIFRIGGDEFAMLFPLIDSKEARVMMERIDVQLAAADGGTGRVSMSYGAAQAVRGESAAQLIERADKALYACKHARAS